MADYYPLLARAIGGLPNKSGDARRVVFERARRALLTQLRSAEPPLAEGDITREQNALEDAIRRLEAELGAPAAEPKIEPPAAAPSVIEAQEPTESSVSEPVAQRDPPAAPTPTPSYAPPPASDEPVLDDDDDLYAAALGAPSPHLAAERRDARGVKADEFSGLRPAPHENVSAPQPAADGESEPDAPAEPPAARPARGRLIGIAVVVLLLIAGAAVGYTQREAILALMGRASGPQTTSIPSAAPTGAAAPELTKSTDRIAQAPSDGSRAEPSPSSAPSPAASSGQGVGVAQRAVLFEESPGGGDQGLQQYVGNVVWETETFSPGQGMESDIGIRATITIPDRNIKTVLRVRRNQDPSIPASHIIEVQFDLPPDFDLGPVANVPGIRAKAVESASGAPLTGISVKVAPGYFLIGLSSLPAERQRNLGMLITRNWLDIPTVFENGRRAILVLEKGVPGEQAFRTAFSAWGLPLPPQTEPAN